MTNLLISLILSFFVALHLIQAADLNLPVVLPPYREGDGGLKASDAKDEWGTCFFYLEGLGVTVYAGSDKSPNSWGALIGSKVRNGKKPNTFSWDDKFVDCKNVTYQRKGAGPNNKFQPDQFSFTVTIKTGDSVEAKQKDKTLFTIDGGKTFSFKLTFETVEAYGWHLRDIEALEEISVNAGGWANTLTVPKGSHASFETVTRMEVGTFNNYNYACGLTKTAWFPTGDKKFDLGIFFQGLQVQPLGAVNKEKNFARFSRKVTDCVGTFTQGSLMGIIIALVLASVLVFGFLMLNSVQTVDRFDDPKQKQLIINAKD